MTTITDSFNRADGEVGANYAQAFGTNALQIVSNQLAHVADSNDSFWIRTAESFTSDQECSITLVSGLGTANRYAQLVARGSGSSGTFTAYTVYTNGLSGASNTAIGRYVAGAFTTLKTIAVTFTAADTVGIRATGGSTVTIAVLKNGSVVDSYDDSSGSRIASGGTIGIGSYVDAGTLVMDNFAGGDYSAGGGGASENNLTLLGVG